YVNVVTYTGTGASNSITGVGFQPDFVWIKNRDQADAHQIFDSVRGVTKYLSSDATTVETADADTLTSFDSDGFTVDADVKVNTNNENYV
ncbi:MAG: hypothetical protein GWN62_02320, partial [Aliifodinibius sp.]|nr:hypothetical protein [Fodinibius sp.]